MEPSKEFWPEAVNVFNDWQMFRISARVAAQRLNALLSAEKEIK